MIICKRLDPPDDHLQQRQQQRQWPSRLPQGAYFQYISPLGSVLLQYTIEHKIITSIVRFPK